MRILNSPLYMNAVDVRGLRWKEKKVREKEGRRKVEETEGKRERGLAPVPYVRFTFPLAH